MGTLGQALGLRDLDGAYLASLPGGPHVNLDPTVGAFQIDGAALAAGEESYFSVTRGAVMILDTRFDTVAQRTIIQNSGIGGLDLESALFPDRATIRINLDQLVFLPQDRTLTFAFSKFLVSSVITLDFVNATFASFVAFSPTVRYLQNANPFGQANLFNSAGFFENDPSGAFVMTTGLTYVGQNRYRANAQTITMIQTLEFLSQPILTVTAAGTFTMTGEFRHFVARGSILVGATLTGDRTCFTADDLSTFTGTLTGRNVGLFVGDLTSGGLGAFGVRSILNSGANRFFLRGEGTARADFGGIVGFGAGTTVDVELVRGAANRLDLAAGDDFRLLGGALQFAGTTERIAQAAGLLNYFATTAHVFSSPVELPSFTVATLPAVTTNRMIIVSDEVGGLVPAFSDGTNWRRVTDRAIVV